MSFLTLAPLSGCKKPEHENPSGSDVIADGSYDPDYAYSAGDTFFLGEYEQDGNLSSSEGERIEWRVLNVEEDRVLAISEKILDARQFDSNDAQGADWASCDLREWLNDSFYNTAFSAADKEHVMMCMNPSYKNPDFKKITGPETVDYVFCLSIYETEEYVRKSFVTMLAEPTRYARDKIISAPCSTINPNEVISDPNAKRPWWLRTNGRDYWLASIILESNEIAYRGRVVTAEDIGVRPAIFLEHN